MRFRTALASGAALAVTGRDAYLPARGTSSHCSVQGSSRGTRAEGPSMQTGYSCRASPRVRCYAKLISRADSFFA